MIEKYCKYCDAVVGVDYISRPDTPHMAEYKCFICNAHLGWIPKEKNETKRPKNKYTPEDLKIDYCEMCLRYKPQLLKNHVLESHHVIEIQDGGKDIPENIWVLCTGCAKLVHWTRRYVTGHYDKES